jgi:hypothetical protein
VGAATLAPVSVEGAPVSQQGSVPDSTWIRPSASMQISKCLPPGTTSRALVRRRARARVHLERRVVMPQRS